MANKKLLQEAIQAFANGNTDVAEKKMRSYFIESAREINSKIEEEMDAEEDMNEDVDTDPEESMTDETGYKLNEDEENDEDEDEELDEGLFSPDINAGGNSVNIGSGSASGEMTEEDEDPTDDFDADEDHEESTEVPDHEQWEKIIDAFDALSSMFDEIENDDDMNFEDEDEDEDEEDGDDFSGVDFGDEHVEESFKMKSVPAPDKTEKPGVDKKSPVAKNAKSPIEGVKPVTIKDGNVDATDDKFKNSDAMDAKVEDHNNVMPNGKKAVKPAKAPKNTAEKSKSVLPNKK